MIFYVKVVRGHSITKGWMGDMSKSFYQGLIVQSIVSLITSLRHQFVKYNVTTLSKYTVIFCWKNVSLFSHFFNKK